MELSHHDRLPKQLVYIFALQHVYSLHHFVQYSLERFFLLILNLVSIFGPSSWVNDKKFIYIKKISLIKRGKLLEKTSPQQTLISPGQRSNQLTTK